MQSSKRSDRQDTDQSVKRATLLPQKEQAVLPSKTVGGFFSTRSPETQKWVHKALDLIFPTVCASCDALGPLICDACKNQIYYIRDPLCHKCGRSLITAAPICNECLEPSFALQQIRAPLAYLPPTDRIIHRLKFEGLFALAKPLAQMMADAWPAWDQEPDVITPIPLHKKRRRERGFNQSALLARHLTQEISVPLDESALQRIKNTKQQIGLTPFQRLENVRDAFIADAQMVHNKQVLLVDDVYTTGATMSAAAEALLASGAAGVSAYCLARTVQ